jgi:1,4-dihydroxy-2-naphthoate octaprenyltransferase
VATPKQQRIDPKSLPAKRGTKSGRPGGRPPGAPPIHQATARDWIAGARLRTIPLAIAPVALGTATAYTLGDGGWHWVRALLCLAVAVGLQIGVNFANDYSDGVRGTDKRRVGPPRLTGSGAAKPRTVLIVAIVFFALAAAAGVVLVVLTQQWLLLAVGAACIIAAWFYTGGKRPYGYYGLGELFVFVFFGLVATAGTTFVQAGTVNLETWLAGTAAGLFACATLMVNNVRDREPDALAKKRTLAVLIGNLPARITYAVLMVLPFGILAFFTLFYDKAGYVFFALVAAAPAILIALTGKTPAELVIALRLTTLTAFVFGVGLALAIAF